MWSLTFEEKLWLYQMPLSMDPSLAVWKSCKRLPFEDTPSPEVYTSVFLPIVGKLCGGFDGRKDGMEDVDDKNVIELGCAAMSTTKARLGGTISHGALPGPEILTREALPDGGDVQEEESEEPVQLSPEGPTLMLPREMRVPRGPDTPAQSESATKVQLQDWIHKLEGDDNRSRLTDEDTITSADTSSASLALVEMVCRMGRTCGGCGLPLCSSCVVEEHKRGPALKLNLGPPFAVGDVIIVNVPGHPPGQQ